MADLSERMWDLSDFLVTTVGGVQRLPDVARAAMESHIIGTVAALSATPGGG